MLFIHDLYQYALLASSVHWLITGKKPTLVLFAQAYKFWRNMAMGTACDPKSDSDIIDTEVKEIQ